jgi:cysteine desulfurase
MRVYLDHAATTPMVPAAVDAMLPFLTGPAGNASGVHADARRARQAVDGARERIAALVGVEFGEVVFTGGGTESDNLAVAGVLEAVLADPSSRSRPTRPVHRTPPPSGTGTGTVVCAAMEHHAVLEACRAAATRHGIELREVPTDRSGVVDLAALEQACTPDVLLVSVMAVNNEIGTVQPLAEVAAIARQGAPGAVLHSDAVQAAPWMDLAPIAALADLVSVSAHKFGGPQGVGALLVRDGTPLRPVARGGGQERDRRSGTLNVAGIVGMAAALEVAVGDLGARGPAVTALRDRLADGVAAAVGEVGETGDRDRRVPGTVHLRFAGIEGAAMVVLLDQLGVSVSAGAACSSGAVGPSHVLSSMGFEGPAASSGVRFSLGPGSTAAEIDRAVAAVGDAVARLRN